MAELERIIVSHYNLSTAFPTEWPAELDESEHEDDRPGSRRSRSRYSALERSVSDRRTLLPNSEQTHDGRANLVQKDEPDPLGSHGSVIGTLRQRGLPVEQDVRMRNKFLLSSTTFSPALFLSQTHSDATTEELVRGLEFLSASIDQKSASLKVLVEANFERFVRAKATIDNVYTEMHNQGMDQVVSDPIPNKRPSRQVSRTSGAHQRILSVNSPPPMPTPHKNALRKETEYGVQGIKVPLLEVTQRAEDVWGPALGGREREASLKSIAEAVGKDRALYELGGELNIAIRQKNYEKAVELYTTARRYADEARELGDKASRSGQTLSDEQIRKVLVSGRMWSDVTEQVKFLKRDVWRKLSNIQSLHFVAGPDQSEEHMDLISVLLQLGVEDNPIWVWLLSRYDNLKNKISAITDRSKVEIEILRRRLAVATPPTPEIAAAYLRSAVQETAERLDDDQIIEFWKTVLTYVAKLVSLSNGLLAEIVDFWETAKAFIDGKKDEFLPDGFEGESQRHHRLSDSGVRDLQNGVVELVGLVREALLTLFANPPTEDISSLVSPTPDSAKPPNPHLSGMFSPSEGRLGNIDMDSIPAPTPKIGERWEDFAFWPPHSNALSAVHYLSKILVLVGTGAGEMAGMAPIAENKQAHDRIKVMVGAARERSLRVVCDAWGKDAEHCKYLEDWLRSPDKRNQTRFPTYFNTFERKVLTGIQQVLYFFPTLTKPSARAIATAPTTKVIQMVRMQFVGSIYKAVSGMLENAESPVKSDENEWVTVSETKKHISLEGSAEVASHNVDANNRDIRMLMTLSNLKALRDDYVPQLIQMFETSFTVKLTDESKTIRDVFGQIDTKLFHAYTRPTVVFLTQLIKSGINLPDWEPPNTRPDQVSPFVYAALMVLVMVHTEVSSTVTNAGTSNAGLLNEILTFLLENVSQALLDGFKERRPNTYSLAALIQATLDTEFIAQTMSQYANTKVTELQNEIYVELDKRTTNDARVDLQKELGVMRGVLKNLREGSRNSFGCFKRPKSDKDRGRLEKPIPP